MKSKIIPACLVMLAALPSCTPKPIAAEPPVQRERTAYLERTADVPIQCASAQDCNDKWARALQWVNRHSVYSVKTHTDSEISTNGPIDPTTDSAFLVTKTQEPNGAWAIHFSSNCGRETQQTVAKTCVPGTLELKSQFKNYLLYGQDHGDY